jgi:CRISPR/Cas system CMR subunit Cmr4 (Cas7 group RAMP superfamily)
MDLFFDVLKVVLPSGLVFLTAYYAIKKFLENEEKKQLLLIRKDSQKMITPIRLQAYERVTMYLERISPNSLINRVYKNGMTARMLQVELLNTIRNEFNHNLSQQVYLSDGAWNLVKNSKEEMIKLINLSSTRVKDDSSGVELSKVILQVTMKIKKLPTDIAIEYLKKEIRQLF